MPVTPYRTWSTDKPKREGQLFLDDLKKLERGTRILKHYDGVGAVVSMIWERLMDSDEKFVCLWNGPSRRFGDEGFLSDAGAVPYHDGRWNPHNWISLDKECLECKGGLPCFYCKGNGKVLDWFNELIPCPICRGSGKVFEQLARYSHNVPDYADLMTVGDFKQSVEDGYFVDYDGSGHPVMDGKMDARITIKPSMVAIIPADATHVAWFNK